MSKFSIGDVVDTSYGRGTVVFRTVTGFLSIKMADSPLAVTHEDHASLVKAFEVPPIPAKIAERRNCIPAPPNPEDKKADTGKIRYSLIPPEAEEALLAVLEFGAKKYAPDNWKQQTDYDAAFTRYYNALRRHLEAVRKGEKTDPDSGLPHIDHVLCNAMFLAYFERQRSK